ncbi:hypothetical protein ACFVFN_20665, partial [Streptomyces pharetrae]
MTGATRGPVPHPLPSPAPPRRAPTAPPRPTPRPVSPPAPPRPVRAAPPESPVGSGEPAGTPVLRLDREKLLAARLHAVKVRPYLADALFALHVVEDRSVPTMAVDAYWRCYVSPAFVART